MAILINGRTAVHKDSKGTLTTIDPCYTGPQRQVVNYQNVAKSSDATNTAKTVFINGIPLCHKNSYFEKSYGSEAGDGGGVKSGTKCGKAEFVTASSNVFIEGIPAVRQGDKMISNNRNTQPAPLQQPGVPFKGDQEKINQFPKMPYPKLEFNLEDLAPGVLPKQFLNISNIFGDSYIAYATFFLTGSLILQKEGLENPLVFGLNGYEIEAKQKLADFTNSLKLSKFNRNEISISSSIASESWTATITPELMGFKAEADPRPVKTIYNNWDIEGNLGFICDVKYQPPSDDFNSVPLGDLIDTHGIEIIETYIGAFLAGALAVLTSIII